jgi:hypothetical protein
VQCTAVLGGPRARILLEAATESEAAKNFERGLAKVCRTPHPRRSSYSRLFRTEPNPVKVFLLSDEHIK